MTGIAPPSAAEVRAMAQQLLTWADQLGARPYSGCDFSVTDPDELVVGLAGAIRETRRLRARIFPDIPLGYPTWDIMLDLFIQEMSGFRITLDHMSLTGELTASTVHRCIEVLADVGLVERTPDRFDSHVTWLSLTGAGKQGMLDMLVESADFVRPVPRANAA